MVKQIDTIKSFLAQIRELLEKKIMEHHSESPLKVSLLDLVFRQGYKDQIHTYTNNELLYKYRDQKDFFYIINFDSNILKMNSVISFEDQLKKASAEEKQAIQRKILEIKESLKPGIYDEYKEAFFNPDKKIRKLEFDIDKDAYEIKKSSEKLKAIEQLHKDENVNDSLERIEFKAFPFHTRHETEGYDQSNIQDFYKYEKNSKSVKILRGAYFYSKKDYLTFVLSLGFDNEISDDMNDTLNEILNSYQFQLHLYELFADLFISDLIAFKNVTNNINAHSQVMSRGLSHSIGSHVLPEYQLYFKKFFKDNIALHEQHQAYIALMDYFKYTQNRMELIPDINISDQHRLSYSYDFEDDVSKPFADIQKNILIALWDAFSGVNQEEQKQISILRTNTSDKRVLLPGGHLGVSSIYLIFENVIRNHFKHNIVSPRDNNFLLKLSTHEDFNHLWQVDLCYSKERDFFNSSSDVLDENECSKKNCAGFNRVKKLIDQKITNSDDELRRTGWGIIEMKTACAYLRNYSFYDLYDDYTEKTRKNSPKLLEVRWYYNNDDKSNGEIGYRFYLMKPKEILFDTNYILEPSLDIVQKYRDMGILFKKVDVKNESIQHDILVTGDRNFSLTRNKRLIDSGLINLNLLNDPKSMLKDVWRLYYDQYYKNVPCKIDPHFSDTKEHDLEMIKKLCNTSYYGYDTKFNSSCKKYFMKPDGFKEKVIANELIRTKILVLDERIQKEAEYHENQNNKRLSFRDTFELCDVMIPKSNDFDLNNIQKEEERTKLKEYFTRSIEEYDYLVIHFTLFKKIFSKCKTEEDIRKKISPSLTNKLVFVSGMGNRANVIKEVMFMNYSTLAYAITKKPDKLLLVNYLKSLS